MELNPAEHFKMMAYHPDDEVTAKEIKSITVLAEPTGKTIWGMEIFTSRDVKFGEVVFCNSRKALEGIVKPKEGV